MEQVDFNAYRGSYRDLVQDSLALPGTNASAFTRVKADHLVELAGEHLGDPQQVHALDVGCGLGETDRFLKDRLGAVDGVDIAEDLIGEAMRANPWARYRAYALGEPIPHEDGAFDLTFTICVLHHVPPQERGQFMREMARVTRPGGMVVIFEHNPLNPLTRRTVNRCEFDRDAELLRMREAKRLLTDQRLVPLSSPYIIFLTSTGPRTRRFERLVRRVPAGAQYFAAARKPEGSG